MNNMLVPKSYFDDLKVLSKFSRESIVYLSEDNSHIYKIYKNSSFEKPKKEKIYQLCQKQSNIKRTILPDGLLFTYHENGIKEFIGISLCYFDNYITINNLDADKRIFLNLLLAIKELTDNYIYPTDLNDGNILVSPSYDIQLIDLDGAYCIVSNQEENEQLKKILHSLLYRIYFAIIDKFPEIQNEVRTSGYEALKQYGYSNEFIEMLKGEEPISYEKLMNLVDQYLPKTNLSL